MREGMLPFTPRIRPHFWQTPMPGGRTKESPDKISVDVKEHRRNMPRK
jgi:hypothetical protein